MLRFDVVWIFVTCMSLLCKGIGRKTCLENVLNFVNDAQRRCYLLTSSSMKNIFPAISERMCQQCDVIFHPFYNNYRHEVHYINGEIKFNGTTFGHIQRQLKNKCRMSRGYYTTLTLQCSIKENLKVGQPCIYNYQCAGQHYLCTLYKCACSGRVIDGICFTGNKAIGELCIMSGECAGYNTVCDSSNKCSCKNGYRQNNGHCIQGLEIISSKCPGYTTISDGSNALKCEDGYRQIEKQCIQVNISLGGTCYTDGDCFGPETICSSNICSCKPKFIHCGNRKKCLRAGLYLGEICEVSSQCNSGNTYCKKQNGNNSKCSCVENYRKDHKGGCHRIGLPLGSICEQDQQCSSSNCSSTNSDIRICSCPTNKIQLNQSCHEAHIRLGQECKYHQQCSGTNFAWLCSRNSSGKSVCTCIQGLMNLNNQECIQGNLHIGAYCNYDLQCVATPNASTCSNHSCECDPGFVQKGKNCIEEANRKPQVSTQNVHDLFNGIGVTVGAMLGGLVLGALIVIAIVVTYQKQNRYKKKFRKNEESVYSNQTYVCGAQVIPDTNISRNKNRINVYSNAETETEHLKVSMVMPIPKQADDIYNHLNEREEEERDDTYDHAQPVQGAGALPLEDDAYMHVQMTKGRDIDVKTSEADDEDVEDDYFTLEKEQTSL